MLSSDLQLQTSKVPLRGRAFPLSAHTMSYNVRLLQSERKPCHKISLLCFLTYHKLCTVVLCRNLMLIFKEKYRHEDILACANSGSVLLPGILHLTHCIFSYHPVYYHKSSFVLDTMNCFPSFVFSHFLLVKAFWNALFPFMHNFTLSFCWKHYYYWSICKDGASQMASQPTIFKAVSCFLSFNSFTLSCHLNAMDLIHTSITPKWKAPRTMYEVYTMSLILQYLTAKSYADSLHSVKPNLLS